MARSERELSSAKIKIPSLPYFAFFSPAPMIPLLSTPPLYFFQINLFIPYVNTVS